MRLVGLLAALLCAATPAFAQEPKPDGATADLLRDIHNRGAALYNAKDAGGCYRLYEGALRAVRGFLGHRPALQADIDKALDDAEKTAGDRLKAFRLHEAIEKVRKDLRVEAPKPVPVPPAPEKKPEPAPAPASKPPEPKPAAPKPPAGPREVSGTVALSGKPLAGAEVMLVSVDLAAPRVLSLTADAAGAFAATADVPPGEYAVTVRGAGVPVKYQSAGSSPLRVTLQSGPTPLALDLSP